jgi:predicted hydrocarbon binding protein
LENSLPPSSGTRSSSSESKGGRRWQDYDKIKTVVTQLLREHPQGLTGAAIAERIGLTPGAVSKYLSMLSVYGVIASRQIGVAKLWKLVTDSDRTGMLAEKISSDFGFSFKDYAHTLTDKDGKLTEADGTRVLIISASNLSNLYDFTRSVLGEQVKPFFYEWGREYVKEMKKFVSDLAVMTNSDFLETFVSLWKLKGWGRFEISRSQEASNNQIVVTWLDSIWATQANRSTNSASPPATNMISDANSTTGRDDFVAGALSMAASYAFGGSWRFVEVECISSNSSLKSCRFEGNPIQASEAKISTISDI